jgi:oligopeptide/dipeptide ABC transporter ATP-binding protein
MNPPAADPSAPLLRVRGLCKHFPVMGRGLLRRQTGVIRAVDDVSFDLRRGETLGLVGESGSGKTTCARAILRALTPTAGSVRFASRGGEVDLAALPERALTPLRQEMQMIFQDPFSSLNPRMTVGDIVAEPLRIHRLATGAELEERVVDMLRRVGLRPEHRQRYPHAFSGGQRQRIGIARALVMRPSFVVADEAVSALDVSVQAQVLNLLKDLQQEFGLTYLFVAHNLGVVRQLCDRVAVMYAGRIVELAPTAELFANPRHPYTRMLLSAEPHPDPDIPMSFESTGEVADAARLPAGCAFHPRCPRRFEPCDRERPALLPAGEGAAAPQAACHLHCGAFAPGRQAG